MDYKILFYNYEDKKEFLKYVNPLRKNILLPKGKCKKLINDVFVDKIKKIEEIKLRIGEYVYDISVPQMQNFIGGCGGIMLHNSGHPSLGTMHAEDVETLIRRLETPPINLSPALVESLDAVCIMTQTKLGNKVVRRVTEIDEIMGVKQKVGSAQINTPFYWDPANDKFFYKSDSKIFDKLVIHFGMKKEKLYHEFRVRTLLLMKMYRAHIRDFKRVQEIIHAYYKTPELVLRKFEIQ